MNNMWFVDTSIKKVGDKWAHIVAANSRDKMISRAQALDPQRMVASWGNFQLYMNHRFPPVVKLYEPPETDEAWLGELPRMKEWRKTVLGVVMDRPPHSGLNRAYSSRQDEVGEVIGEAHVLKYCAQYRCGG